VPGEAGHRHALGIVLNLAPAEAYSTSGFYTRLIPLDPWAILFWRFARGQWHPTMQVADRIDARSSLDRPARADIELPAVLPRGTATRRVYR